MKVMAEEDDLDATHRNRTKQMTLWERRRRMSVAAGTLALSRDLYRFVEGMFMLVPRTSRAPHWMVAIGMGFLIWGLLLDSAKPQDKVDQRSLSVLDRHDIQPTLDGVRAFLDQLDPQHEIWRLQRNELSQLLKDLGSAKFEIRERAYARILTLHNVSTGDLQAASDSSDLEVAWRAQSLLQLLKSPKRNRDDTLDGIVEAVADAICLLELNGLTTELLSAMPRFEDKETIEALSRAVKSSAMPHDIELLRVALRDASSNVRIAALLAIDELLAEQSFDDLAKMAEDENEEVAIVAVNRMAQRGHRAALEPLVALLESEEVHIRYQAVSTLRGLTGQQLGFVVYADADNRAKRIAAWQDWLRTEGKSARLNHPLKSTAVLHGLTIVTQYGKNLVLELDREGKERWRTEIDSPWGCQGLPNGHRVISSYRGKYVVEFDEEGREVWRVEGLPGNAMGLHRLVNGNTVVACSASNWVMEYNLAGEVVWKAHVVGRPVDVIRLGDGNTVVALENQTEGQKVVEVDRHGDVVWEIDHIDTPLAIQRLANGHTMVGSSGGKSAYEYDRMGNMVWHQEYGNKVTGVFRIADGGLIVSTVSEVTFFDDAGNEAWRLDGLKYAYGMTHY